MCVCFANYCNDAFHCPRKQKCNVQIVCVCVFFCGMATRELQNAKNILANVIEKLRHALGVGGCGHFPNPNSISGLCYILCSFFL